MLASLVKTGFPDTRRSLRLDYTLILFLELKASSIRNAGCASPPFKIHRPYSLSMFVYKNKKEF